MHKSVQRNKGLVYYTMKFSKKDPNFLIQKWHHCLLETDMLNGLEKFCF